MLKLFSKDLLVKYLGPRIHSLAQRTPKLSLPDLSRLQKRAAGFGRSDSPPDPGRAARLSCIFGGTGQLYLGQTAKGRLIIALSILGLAAAIFPGIIVIGLGAYDAYVIAERLKKHGSVRPWEFFWHKPRGSNWRVLRVEQCGIAEQFLGVETLKVDNLQGDAAVTRRLKIYKEWSQSYVVEHEKVQSTTREFEPQVTKSSIVRHTVENLVREKYSYSKGKKQVVEEEVVIEVPPRKSIRVELQWKNILANWLVTVRNEHDQEVKIPISVVTKLSFDQKIVEA